MFQLIILSPNYHRKEDISNCLVDLFFKDSLYVFLLRKQRYNQNDSFVIKLSFTSSISSCFLNILWIKLNKLKISERHLGNIWLFPRIVCFALKSIFLLSTFFFLKLRWVHWIFIFRRISSTNLWSWVSSMITSFTCFTFFVNFYAHTIPW